MSSSSVARCVAVVAFAVAVRSGALADPLSVPLTFDCSVYARIDLMEPPGTQWVQYGTNSASVTDGGHHCDISFTSGSSGGNLDAFTSESLSSNCEVGTLAPSHLTIGTTPELPAGTPLLLTLQTTGSSVMRPSLTLDVNRGTASLIHQTDGDFDQWWVYPTQATATALVLTVILLAEEAVALWCVDFFFATDAVALRLVVQARTSSSPTVKKDC